MSHQLTLFEAQREQTRTHERSGSFVDNMSLPIHRWFRYSAGFSAEWVESLIRDWRLDANSLILDPFAGSGTVMVVAGASGVASVGIEAHPFVARIAGIKLRWNLSLPAFAEKRKTLLEYAKRLKAEPTNYPQLILHEYRLN